MPPQQIKGENALWRNIVKKIFSLIIALTLLVSIFAVSAVAFADGERTVTVETAGNEYLLNKVGNDTYLEDTKDFKGWLTTTADVKAVFTGINFAMASDADYDKSAKYDTVRLEYCTADPRFDDNWQDDEKTLVVADGGTSFNLKLSGWVCFRYSATYKPTADGAEKTVYTEKFLVFVRDVTAPEVEMGTTLTDKVEDGLTVGKAYSVSTSSSSIKVTDSSTYTITFVIKKLIKGEYVEVYSSKTGLSEDYEGKDISNGTITPTADDVMDKATYQIVYSVTDANGYKSQDLVASLKVNAAEVQETEKKVDVLKIVLYVVAGLSAVGIIVLVFFVKPKKVEETRVVYTEDTNNTNDQQ